MTTPEPLGHLLHLRIWHDNTGDTAGTASWFVDKMVVEDIQSKQT